MSVANYLLHQHEASGRTRPVELRVEKKTQAALLGMTPENLSRAFAALKPHGVEVERHVVHIRNAVELRSLAQPNPLIDGPAG